MRPVVALLHVRRGRRLPGRRVVARRQHDVVLLVLLLLLHVAQAAPVRGLLDRVPVRLGHLDLVTVRVGPVLDLEHQQYDEHDDYQRGGRDEHHVRRALGRLGVDRRLGVLGRRRFGHRLEENIVELRRGLHRLAVAFVAAAAAAAAAVPAAATAVPAAAAAAVEERRFHRGRARTRGAGDRGAGDRRVGRVRAAAGHRVRDVRRRRADGRVARGRAHRGRGPVRRLRQIGGRHRRAVLRAGTLRRRCDGASVHGRRGHHRWRT